MSCIRLYNIRQAFSPVKITILTANVDSYTLC